MSKSNICIFGGTTEGRKLAEFLSNNNINADLHIATEYGQQFIQDLKNIRVFQNRLNEDEMTKLFKSENYDYIIDATHPFAKIVTENIIKSAANCNIKYLRIIRNSNKNEYCKYFESIESCVKYLQNKEGNILLTTGSKDLNKFTEINNFAERIFIRILPMISSLEKCIELGFLNKNVICIQGPISEELNVAMINSVHAHYVVTKESADSGGFDEKVNACIISGAECLVITMPDENGMTLEEICDLLKNV